MAEKNYYTTLGVRKGASKKEIQQAYRKLARQYHPDVNPGDTTSEARFKEINAAYEVLSDPEKQKRYDKYGDQWQYSDQIEEMQRRGGQTFRFGGSTGTGFDTGDLGSLFGSLFGQARGGQARRPRRPANVEQPIEVTLEEAFSGTSRMLQMTGEGPCPTCGGSREIAGAVCHVCQGSGLARGTRRIEAKIPAGVDTGSRVRIAGEGRAGPDGRRSDLILVVSVRPHDRFERKGSNLYTDVEVPLTDAVLGSEVEVPTMTGKVMLTLPPLTPNGKAFRLAGVGMPRLKGGAKGHLYARVQVMLPEKLSDDDKKLFEQLREAGI